MIGLLIFAGTLVVAVLLSGLAHRSVLSTSVLFLGCGFLVGDSVLGWVHLNPQESLPARLVEFALFGVLFVDGMRLDFHDLRRRWQLPVRALAIGMPLTMVGIALLVRWLSGLSWLASFLIGAILSPTDPVFAEAIVSRQEIPPRLRHLLNVESGLNDGLALPAVLILLNLLRPQAPHIGLVIWEVIAGAVMGVVVAWIVLRLVQSRWFSAVGVYEPLVGVSIGLLVLGVGMVTGIKEFLGAFAAAVTVATFGEEACRAFHPVGEVIAELLKLAALLVFGIMIRPNLFVSIGWEGYVFAVLVLVVVRPAALLFAFWGSGIDWPQWLAAAWFGPRGFASVLFGLYVLRSGVATRWEIANWAAIVIIFSIVAHSSTDVLIARWFARQEEQTESPEQL